MYRIAQLTDIHIGQDGEDTFGIDVRANFQRALELALGDDPDEIVITGDLAFRSGHRDIYNWIVEQLRARTNAWAVLPGNHDDPQLLKEVAGDHALCDGLHRRAHGARDILYLDTSPSSVSDAQVSDLKQALAEATESPIVFVHHPPTQLGVPYMDEGHMLENHAQLMRTLETCRKPVDVFCGHYHVERSVVVGNIRVFSTPSTFFQIDARQREFAVDHRRPGYRNIAFHGPELQTTVRWVDD